MKRLSVQLSKILQLFFLCFLLLNGVFLPDGTALSAKASLPGGMSLLMTAPAAPAAANSDARLTIYSCKASRNGTVTVKGKVSGGTLPAGTRVALCAVEPYEDTVSNARILTEGSSSGNIVRLKAAIHMNDSESVLQKKFCIGVAYGNSYRRASDFYYIQNPEVLGKIKGSFPYPARGTKKGIKSIIYDDRYIDQLVKLNASHVITDLPLDGFLNGSNYSYRYEGKTYYFNKTILTYKKQIRKLCRKGIAVTGIFYLSNRTMTEYMLPSAASGDKSGAAIFALNTETPSRKKLEALFSCLAEEFNTGGAHLGNWIFGNESDQYHLYHYSGNISRNEWVEHYCDAFRMFNTAVKSRYANARTYLSFDHNWNISRQGTYPVKGLLDDIQRQFAKEGKIHWDLALHPYPSPELDPRTWVRSSLVKDSSDTPQYTLLNINSICTYVKQKYGWDIHIILSEVGINSVLNGKNAEELQAAGIAWNYYMAEFASPVDLIGIHRLMEDPGEYAGGFHLGLYKGSFQNPKAAAEVFRYMDTPQWQSYAGKYAQLVGGSKSWPSLIPGFLPGRFH